MDKIKEVINATLKANRIDVTCKKSKRRNAKYIYKQKIVFPDVSNMKQSFKLDDINDFISFITHAKKEGYPEIEISFNGMISPKRYSIEQVINDLFEIMQYGNYKRFDISLSDLHSDRNIRYLINQYYHG